MVLSTKAKNALKIAMADNALATEVTTAIDAAGTIDASELADDAVDTAAIQDDAVTQAKIAPNAAGTAGTGVTAVENGVGDVHHTTLTLADVNLGTIAGAAAEATGALIYTLPAGAMIIEQAYMTIGLTNTDGNIDADTPDLGIGTTVGSGANATLAAVGAAAENIITGQTANDVTGTAEVVTISNQVLSIESAGDHTIYLNVADTWAGAESTGVVANGTIVFKWVKMA